MDDAVPSDEAPDGPVVTAVDITRAPLYLDILDSLAEGLDWRALAVSHFQWRGEDEARMRRIVESHVRRALWMRDGGYKGVLGATPPAREP